MDRHGLFDQITRKNSYLCVGLDTDLQKVPQSLLSTADPVFEFNKQIIDATHPYCVAYKPNIAFYEAQGPRGWESLQKTLEYIPKEIFTIADAKRGDIGNTAHLYARTFFDPLSAGLDFDAVTVAPYMGKDSVDPFLAYRGKWAIVLVSTSNSGSLDFQYLIAEGKELYLHVLNKCLQWGTPENLMMVVGATRPEVFRQIREVAPDNFLLVPGIGAQGGDLEEVSRLGMNSKVGLLINSSRDILYASSKNDFGRMAGLAAQKLQQVMQRCLQRIL